MTDRATRFTLVFAVLASLLLLVACAEAPSTEVRARPASPHGPETGPDPGTGSDLDSPPPVTVRFFDGSIELRAWTYCYGNVCADGSPPDESPDVGDPEQVLVEFPLPGWSFTAYLRPAGDECGRELEIPLEPTGDGAFVLHPVGHADTYDVTLFGVGGGDLFVSFRWTTPRDGPLPSPEARLAVLADHDGLVDSYGVELAVSNLARTPREASATITVRNGSGEAVSFEATRGHAGCLPEGTVYWDGPDREGLAAAALGDGPFTYEVEIVLDGLSYVAVADWPADEIAGNEPSVALDFTPDLPALS